MEKVFLPKSLKFKVALHLAIGLTLAVALFTIFIVRNQRNELLGQERDHIRQVSEIVTKSTRFAMLQNQRSAVYRIIKSVGSQEGIDRVRILNSDGMIVYSSDLAEIASSIDLEAEKCLLCHIRDEEPPLGDTSGHSRIITGPGGARYLSNIDIITNEPSCYQNVICHAHPEDQKVLGLLEITHELSSIDMQIRHNTFTIAAFSLGLVIVASLFVSILVHRMVYLPLIDLERGAKRLKTGDLEKLIPVRSRDEFGHLASSFNAMMLSLRDSELELQKWARTLEQKVEEKTTELQVAEAKAVHAEKLASVGLLAAGIAHELNNPLTGVLTFSTIIRRKMEDGSPDAEDLDLVIRETKRCSTIIKRLLDFAREKKPEHRFIDITDIIKETEQILRHPASSRDIRITLDFDEDLPQIWVDPDQIKQVIMNILVNAQDAVSSDGEITIRTRRLPEKVSVEPGSPPLAMAEISIKDTGCGIPEHNKKRIFDPFFTSKVVGKGTGLGLSVTYGIVRAHGGTIDVESKEGVGTTFRILLPLESIAVEA
jgi:two-component system NtrC family sensor kinase